MRIALVHSFYTSASPSGENEVVRAELDALADAGHDVRLFSRDTDEMATQPWYRLRSAGRIITGWGENPGARIRDFEPDVVHVHNLTPNLGRAWLRSLPFPFVHTLHNFRPFCASTDHYRAGEICHLCTDQGAWNAVRHRCYRDSRLASAPLAVRTGLGVGRDPVFTHAARVIALSEQMEHELQQAGVAAARITRWPNFLPRDLDPLDGGSAVPDAEARSGFLFVGRLTAAKGVVDLLRSWPPDVPLTIVGSGPAGDEVDALARGRTNVRVAGRLPRHEVIAQMLAARALVLPSRWYEGFPVVYPEALACGLPVLATDPSSPARQVEADGTGRRFPDVASLAEAVRQGPLHLPEPARVRAVFDATYTQAMHVDRAEALYREVATART